MSSSNLEILRDSWYNSELSLVESIDTPSGDYTGVVLATLKGPALDYINDTRNRRGYEEDLWDEVAQSDYVRELFETKNFLGEPDHPMQWENRTDIHYPYVSHAIRELIKNPAKGCYDAVIDILDTPNGRILKTLIDYGTKLGVSSRGAGRTIVKNGRTIVDKVTYRFITIDIVPMPGFAKARMTTNESVSADSELISVLSDQIDCMIESGNKDLLESIKCSLSHLDGNYNALIEKVDEYLNRSEDTSNTYTGPSQDLIEAYALIESLKRENESKDLIIKDLSERAQSKETAQEDMQNTLSDINEKYEKARKMIKSVLSESMELRRENRELAGINSELSESYRDLTSRYESLLSNSKSMNESIIRLREEIVDSKNENSEEIIRLQESNEALSRDLDSVSSQLNYANESLRSMTESYLNLRCKQVGINPSLVSSRLNENLLDVSADRINQVVNEAFKNSANSTSSRSLSGIRIMDAIYNQNVTPSMNESYLSKREDLDSSDLSSITASARSLRNS